MKTNKSWLMVLAAVATLTTAQTLRGITFGQPDGDLHPNVGAIMITWPDIRGPFSSGTLVYKSQDGRTGVFLTAGHSTDVIQAGIDNGEITPDQVTVNFSPEAKSPEQDIRVVGIHTLLVHRHNFCDWDDVGLLVLEVDDPGALPQPAVLAPVGFLDQFSQGELHDSELVAVGYGASLSFPPPRLVENLVTCKRQFSTPKYLNLVARSIMEQTSGAAGNSGIAPGDSGGPLFWKDPQTSAEFIVGIAHGAPGSEQAVNNWLCVAYHYRADTQVVHDFIRTVAEAYP